MYLPKYLGYMNITILQVFLFFINGGSSNPQYTVTIKWYRKSKTTSVGNFEIIKKN